MRLIDADVLKTVIAETLVALERNPRFDGLQTILIVCVFDMVGKIIDNTPTVDANHIADRGKKVDAVEVVRCVDCKHYLDGGCGNVDKKSPCKNLMGVKPNWYCADGERKEQNDG